MNLKIESFTLYMENQPYDGYHLANKLIVKALKMGATRFGFRHKLYFDEFVLPHEVLGSENLVLLSVEGCIIDHGVDHVVRCSRLKSLILRSVKIRTEMLLNILSSCPLIENLSLTDMHELDIPGVDNRVSEEGCEIDRGMDLKKVTCPRLKSLTLCYVMIECDMISNIISGCPMIQKLSLSDIYEFVEGSVENLFRLLVEGCGIDQGVDPQKRCSRLKSLSLDGVEIKGDSISNIISSCPLIEKLSLNYTSFDPINLHKLHKIRCLVLDSLNIDTLFSSDFSSKLPFLKKITLNHCTFEDGIQISSRSLENLTFALDGSLRVEFDVPSIQKFTLKGSISRSLSFKTTSTKWESHACILCPRRLTTSWFRKLDKFLTELKLSKIYLSLDIKFSKKCFDYNMGDIQGLFKPQVENLTMDFEGIPSLSCYALFDGLFRLCQPQSITQSLLLEKIGNDFLCKKLEQRVNEKCSTPSHCVYGLHYLQEVNVQRFDEVVALWKPVPWKSLLDASKEPRTNARIRVQFKWRQ